MRPRDPLGRRLSSVPRRTLLLGVVAHALVAAEVRAAPNDAYGQSLALVGNNPVASGSNADATRESGEPIHASNPGGRSLWWHWVAPSDGDLTITTDGSAFDTLLAVYTGTSLPGLVPVADNDDHGETATSRVRFRSLKGVTYQIAVDGFNDGATTGAGNVRLALDFLPEPIVRPSNDDLAHATVLSGPTATGQNLHATRETGEPRHAGELGDTSVWWTWTASRTGPMRLDTAGSSFDTLLGVYTGTSTAHLTEVAANDDADRAAGISTSKVVFAAVMGTTYSIAVDGFDGASGTIRIAIGDYAPARLEKPERLPDGTFRMLLSGSPGSVHAIDGSTDLGTWVRLGSVTNATGTVTFPDPDAASRDRRFYRATLISP